MALRRPERASRRWPTSGSTPGAACSVTAPRWSAWSSSLWWSWWLSLPARSRPIDYAEGDSNENYMMPGWLADILPGDVRSYTTIGDKFPLGADYLGRDLLWRIIYGARVSLPVGFMGAMTALVIGLVYGCISGYYGGRVDNIMMRIVDIMYAFPTMLLIILLMAFFKTSFGGQRTSGHNGLHL